MRGVGVFYACTESLDITQRRNPSFIHRFSATFKTTVFAEVKGFCAAVIRANKAEGAAELHDRDRACAFSHSEAGETNKSESLPRSERQKKQSPLVQSLCKPTRSLGCLFVSLFFFSSCAAHVILLRKNGCPFFPRCRTSGAVKKQKQNNNKNPSAVLHYLSLSLRICHLCSPAASAARCLISPRATAMRRRTAQQMITFTESPV